MPEFRTFVMRRPPIGLLRGLRSGVTLCAVVGAAVLAREAWAPIATDLASLLRALPWLAAPWH